MDRETNKKLSQKINREEAIKIFGEEIVKEAEQEKFIGNKYSLCKDDNGKITWISIENQNGEVEIKKIKNTTDNTKYIEELISIDSKYNDFLNKALTGEFELKNDSYFENMKKIEQEKKMKAKETDQKTLLENEDLIRCNYFTGQKKLLNLSQGSRDVQEIDDLFKNEKLGRVQQLMNEALESMEKARIALELYTNKHTKLSREEAIKIFGEEKVKEVEKRVQVDTNGINDTNINEANKHEEEKKEQLEQAAYNYEKDYVQGNSDGYAERAKAKNTPGYNVGYTTGQKLREAENEPDIEIKEELFEKSTPKHR